MTQQNPASVLPPGQTRPMFAVAESPERVFTRKALIAVGIALAAILLVMFIYQIQHVLVLVFAATLLAVLLTTPSGMLTKYLRIPPAYALAIVLVTSVLLAAGTMTFIGSTLRTQIGEVQKTLPQAVGQLRENLKTTPWGLWLTDQLRLVPKGLEEYLTPEFFFAQAGGIATSTFGALGSVLVVLIVGVYLAVSPSTYVNGLATLFPLHARKRVNEIFTAIGTALQWWFFGQALAMTEVFLLTTLGLTILGMPSALALGLLAGLLNIVPNFGPILAAIPAVILAAAPHDAVTGFDFKRALYVTCVYIIVQVLDAYIVSPIIQKRAVALPPALIMLSQIVALALLGPVGLLVSTPILAALLVIVRMAYVEDILGDRGAPLEPRLLETPTEKPAK